MLIGFSNLVIRQDERHCAVIPASCLHVFHVISKSPKPQVSAPFADEVFNNPGWLTFPLVSPCCLHQSQPVSVTDTARLRMNCAGSDVLSDEIGRKRVHPRSFIINPEIHPQP